MIAQFVWKLNVSAEDGTCYLRFFLFESDKLTGRHFGLFRLRLDLNRS